MRFEVSCGLWVTRYQSILLLKPFALALSQTVRQKKRIFLVNAFLSVRYNFLKAWKDKKKTFALHWGLEWSLQHCRRSSPILLAWSVAQHIARSRLMLWTKILWAFFLFWGFYLRWETRRPDELAESHLLGQVHKSDVGVEWVGVPLRVGLTLERGDLDPMGLRAGSHVVGTR